MAKVQVGILGLGRLGASFGLALKRHTQTENTHEFIITGYDSVTEKAKTAKSMGAIDHQKNRPEDAVRDKNIVIVAMPYGEVSVLYRMIGASLARGTVVIDLSTLKQGVMEQANKHMPEGTHLVCGAPVLNINYLFEGVDETKRATNDLFDTGMMLLMPSVKCAQEAITLAHDLTVIIGATPQFFDPAEHDALISMTESLPALLGISYFSTLTQSNGWDDSRKLTNASFGALTHFLFDHHPEDLLSLWLDNKEALTRNINDFIHVLTTFRDLVKDNDRDSLKALLEDKATEYETWINLRNKNTWNKDKIAVKTPTMADTFGGAMFGGFMRRKDDGKDS
jgi:prephenate dehydrogenase